MQFSIETTCIYPNRKIAYNMQYTGNYGITQWKSSQEFFLKEQWKICRIEP